VTNEEPAPHGSALVKLSDPLDNNRKSVNVTLACSRHQRTTHGCAGLTWKKAIPGRGRRSMFLAGCTASGKLSVVVLCAMVDGNWQGFPPHWSLAHPGVARAMRTPPEEVAVLVGKLGERNQKT
jgi:hypothetical protein